MNDFTRFLKQESEKDNQKIRRNIIKNCENTDIAYKRIKQRTNYFVTKYDTLLKNCTTKTQKSICCNMINLAKKYEKDRLELILKLEGEELLNFLYFKGGC